MNGFWDLKCTDGRTDGGEFKGPNRLRRGTNKIVEFVRKQMKGEKMAIFLGENDKSKNYCNRPQM